MSSERAKKSRVRGGHKAAVTRRIKDVDDTIAAATPGSPLDLTKLATLRISLREKLDALSKLDEEIFELIEDETELATDIETADAFNMSIHATIMKIDEQARHSASAPPAASGTATALAPTSSNTRLPKLQPPSFDGDITKWATFWDAFDATIHRNASLSDIDKFTYLKSSLHRTAREAIAGLTLSSANYREALTILEKRFGNKQLIISRHMNILVSLEPVSSGHNVSALRHLYDQVESHVRSLKSLGITADSYGSLLLPLLTKKLPAEIRLIISRKVPENEWKLDEVMTVLEDELKAQERSAQPHREPPPARENNRPTNSFVIGGTPTNTCCYCRQNHQPHLCQLVPALETRKQSLRRSGRCFNCLTRGHLGRDCRSKLRCATCGGRHHLSICDKTGQHAIPKNKDTGARTDKNMLPSPNPELNPGAPPFNPEHTTTTVCSSSSQVVFLQTAKSIIQNPETTEILEVRLLLDSGSQKSYISERAREKLGIDACEEHTLTIATFGSAGNRISCPMVEVGLQLQDSSVMSLKLYVVPKICEPLAVQPLSICSKKHKHIIGLQLADPTCSTSVSLPVDVLIGADVYWKIVTNKLRRGPHGPTAIFTKLGWVLSGPSDSVEPYHRSTNLVTHILHVQEPTLDSQLQAFWDLETMGISSEGRSLYDNLAEVIKFENGRYKVPLPWKETHDSLPDNYQLSSTRLQSLLRRLKRDPVILSEYHRIMEDQLKQGIIELVPTHESVPNQIHYLPHHPVVRQDKSTTKVRIVFDASAKSPGRPSLNDCLFKGPKFDQLIFDILLRFRVHKIALIADLEKAFLMIFYQELKLKKKLSRCIKNQRKFFAKEGSTCESLKPTQVSYKHRLTSLKNQPD